MFKIVRVQVVRLASLCAILFVASSFLASRRAIQTVNCARHNQNELEEDGRLKSTQSTTGSNESTLATASATNSDQVVSDGTGRRRGDSSLALLFRSSQSGHNDGQTGPAQRQPAFAGKILDYTTTESQRHQHHIVSPRRLLNSSSLFRLVAVPFKTKSSSDSRQADRGHDRESRARSIGESNEQQRDNQHYSSGTPTDEPAGRKAKCATVAAVTQRRSSRFGDVFRGARNLLSSGISSIEQRAGTIMQLASSLLATLIPLVSLMGPSGHAHSLTEADGTSNSTAGRPSRVASLLAPPQKLIQIAANSGGIQSRVEHVMDWLERSIEHLPNFPRLHPQECVKRSICEAHNEPAKYGAIGLALRLLFPATNFSGPTSEQDNMEFKVINKYRHAAGYGLLRRLDSTGSANGNSTTSNVPASSWPNSQSSACKEKYEDCLVSLLDVAQKVADLFVT